MSQRDYRKGVDHMIASVTRQLERDRAFFNDDSIEPEGKAEADYIAGARYACNLIWDALQPVFSQLQSDGQIIASNE